MITAFGQTSYNSWIKPLQISKIDNFTVHYTAPTSFIKDWVNTNYRKKLLKLWRQVDDTILSIEIAAEKTPAQVQANNSVVNLQKYDAKPSDNIDNRFSFDNFIVSQGNELAFLAAKQLATNDKVTPGTNPLYIHGGVGLGKTHLLNAIANQYKAEFTGKKVVYLTAEKFLYKFVRSLKEQKVLAFKDELRDTDILLIDDVQFISSKAGTREEFYHTINDLIDNNKKVVIAGDRCPHKLEGFEERLRSRLGGGLVVNIGDTDEAQRLAILQSKAKQFCINIPNEVLEFLANRITSNVRELEGALNRVAAHAQLVGRGVTMQSTKGLLGDVLNKAAKIIDVKLIKAAVANEFNIGITDLSSKSRQKSVVEPRHMAVYLCTKLTSMSLPEIGKSFGGRDHTTILHSVKKIQAKLKDADFAEQVDGLVDIIKAG